MYSLIVRTSKWYRNGKSCRHITTHIGILFFISVVLRSGIVILLRRRKTAGTVLLLKKWTIPLLQLQRAHLIRRSFTSEFQLLLNFLGGVHWYGEPHECLGLLYRGELQPRPRQLCVTGDGCGLLSYTRILSNLLSAEFPSAGSCGEHSTFGGGGVLFDGVAAFLDLINGDLYFKLIFTKNGYTTGPKPGGRRILLQKDVKQNTSTGERRRIVRLKLSKNYIVSLFVYTAAVSSQTTRYL